MSSDLKKYCVYLITCLVNGKQYCGQTGIKPKKRFSRHKTAASRGRGSLIGQAIREHGIESFVFVVLRENLTKKEADAEERLVIRLLRLQNREFGYNVAVGGSGEGSKKRKFIDDKEVAEAYLSGMSTTEVGKKFGIDNSTVGEWLHDMGIELRKAAPKKIPTPDEKILSLYRSGLSSVEIGERLKVSDFVVVDRLKSLGEPLRPAKKGLLLPIEDLKKLHASGNTLKQLASLAGTTAMTVRSRLLEHGCPPRPIGDWVKRKDLDTEEIAKMYKAGLNGRQIAEILNCGEITIRKHLLEAGVTMRPRGTRPKIAA